MKTTKTIKTLGGEITTILINSILDIFEKTKDCKKVRSFAIAHICICCCNILTNNRMKEDDKIDLFEKITKKCVDDVDKTIDKINENVEKMQSDLFKEYIY